VIDVLLCPEAYRAYVQGPTERHICDVCPRAGAVAHHRITAVLAGVLPIAAGVLTLLSSV